MLIIYLQVYAKVRKCQHFKIFFLSCLDAPQFLVNSISLVRSKMFFKLRKQNFNFALILGVKSLFF